MNRDLKKKYQDDFKKVTAILNEYDFFGLITNGSPSNEYDCLTESILSCFNRKCTRLEIKETILNELNEHFGTFNSNAANLDLELFIDEIITRIETSLIN